MLNRQNGLEPGFLSRLRQAFRAGTIGKGQVAEMESEFNEAVSFALRRLRDAV